MKLKEAIAGQKYYCTVGSKCGTIQKGDSIDASIVPMYAHYDGGGI